MDEYKDMKTGENVKVTKNKDNFSFPTSGVRILHKSRPPVTKEVTTD